MSAAGDPLGQSPLPARPDDAQPTNPLERYELEAPLGKSPYAATWIAVDRNAAERRRVVLKLFSTAFTRSIGTIEFFEQRIEAVRTNVDSLLPRLEHYGWHDDQFFAVFEQIEGEPLDQTLASSGYPLPATTQHALVRSLAGAVHALHAAGFLHLGLIPSALVFDRTEQRVRLVDWGLMLPLADPSTSQTPFPGVGMDAAPYASTELLGGEHPAPRDDIYAAGCIAYELLSGAHPYGRRTAREAANHGLTPAPIASLDRTQSTRLLNALAPKREARSVTLAELAAAFGGPRTDAYDPLPSAKLFPLRAGVLARFAGALVIAIGLGVGYMMMGGGSSPNDSAHQAKTATPATQRESTFPQSTPAADTSPISARDPVESENNDRTPGSAAVDQRDPGGSNVVPPATEPALPPIPVPPTGLPPDRARSVAIDDGALPSTELAKPTGVDIGAAIEPNVSVAPTVTPPASTTPVATVESAREPSARSPDSTRADPRTPRSSPPSASTECAHCDCASIAFKRTFTTEPIRPEEQRFFARHCAP